MENNNNENILISIPKKYKKDEYANTPFIVHDTEIILPPYVRNSISRYAFTVVDDTILLCRKCNNCSKFIEVQKYENNNFVNLPNLEIAYRGEVAGFESYCNECLPYKNIKNSKLEPTTHNSDNMVQVNIKIDAELKKYFRIEAAKNNTKLSTELIKALIFYKNNKTII